MRVDRVNSTPVPNSDVPGLPEQEWYENYFLTVDEIIGQSLGRIATFINLHYAAMSVNLLSWVNNFWNDESLQS